VRVKAIDDLVRITVEDTGPGFSTDRSGSPAGAGVGLANVRKRLKLCYGRTANLSIQRGHSVRESNSASQNYGGVSEYVSMSAGGQKRTADSGITPVDKSTRRFRPICDNQEDGGALIRTLIVDDEPIARKVLREELAPFDDVEIVEKPKTETGVAANLGSAPGPGVPGFANAVVGGSKWCRDSAENAFR